MSLHRVNYLIRDVDDVEKTSGFYREFGLKETARGTFASRVGEISCFCATLKDRRVCMQSVSARTHDQISTTSLRGYVASAIRVVAKAIFSSPSSRLPAFASRSQ
ncbi:hypothetical protein [Pedococcus sp. P5_B7]